MSCPHKVEAMKMSELKEWQHVEGNSERVLHWYDFLCPFCYVV